MLITKFSNSTANRNILFLDYALDEAYDILIEHDDPIYDGKLIDWAIHEYEALEENVSFVKKRHLWNTAHFPKVYCKDVDNGILVYDNVYLVSYSSSLKKIFVEIFYTEVNKIECPSTK